MHWDDSTTMKKFSDFVHEAFPLRKLRKAETLFIFQNYLMMNFISVVDKSFDGSLTVIFIINILISLILYLIIISDGFKDLISTKFTYSKRFLESASDFFGSFRKSGKWWLKVFKLLYLITLPILSVAFHTWRFILAFPILIFYTLLAGMNPLAVRKIEVAND